MRPFVARHPGKCRQCAGGFSRGDRIVASRGGGYVHESCKRLKKQKGQLHLWPSHGAPPPGAIPADWRRETHP